MKRYIVYSAVFLISGAISYADIYQIPLDVNGYYEFLDSVSFSVDLGTQLTEIHDVRFSCSGDIAAMYDPGFFTCVLPADADKDQYADTDPISSFYFTPFTCNDVPFMPADDATWDFLLDGEASGYVQLITNIIYIPEDPPLIYGNIYSASISIDATPVPEPCMLLLFGGGSIILYRKLTN